MMLQNTNNGIMYEWYSAGRKQVNIVLMPIEGTHSIVDVVDAKQELSNKRNVNKFEIKWKTHDTDRS